MSMACRTLSIKESDAFQFINMLLNCSHRDTYFLGNIASCDIVISIYQFINGCSCFRQPFR